MILDWCEIKKVINGSASEKEIERFNIWLNEDPKHKVYFAKMEYYYNNTSDAESENQFAKHFTSKQIYAPKRRSFYRSLVRIAIPAAALVIFSLLVKYEWSGKKTDAPINKSIVVEAKQIIEEIKIVTEEGDAFLIDTIVKRNSNVNINTVSDKLVYKASDSDRVIYHTIVVPHGKTYIVELSDGTTCHLNACSSLKYPISFKNGTSREVYLEGEGFFNVAKNEKDRFIVKVNKLDIIVYGTEFNVNCYDETIKTVLVEGSVAVVIDGKETKMKPNQKLEVVKATGETIISEVNTAKYVAWQRNYFTFENEKLDNIARTLTRWYNVEIEFANESVRNLLINCNTPKYNSITDFLDVLKNTGSIDYHIDKNKYILK